jgi:hypothetical protein
MPGASSLDIKDLQDKVANRVGREAGIGECVRNRGD